MNKKMQYLIGIDIGGTNTDAVIIDSQRSIQASCKIATEKMLESSVKKSIEKLLSDSGVSSEEIKGIYIGTTHATNAILESKGLFKVGVLRLAGQKPNTLDPCFKWPEALRGAILAGSCSVGGGFRCDQIALSPLSESEIAVALRRLVGSGMESLAISGVFSPLSNVQELEAMQIAKTVLGDSFPITISSEIGGMGFVERENASILNAALKKPMAEAFENMEKMKNALGIKAPLYVTQNDGSIIDLKQAIAKPLLTVSSGPTNSFIGGAKLASLQDAIVVDIGGTSADVGVVLNGYPRRSLGQAMIGGIPLNFRMPDVLSLPIGGGSVVRRMGSGFTFGPDSLGSRLFKEGFSFGGNTLTLTDAAGKASLTPISEEKHRAIPLTEDEAKSIVMEAIDRIQDAVRIMRGSKKHLPVIAVGGGAFFLNKRADSIPQNSGVANAYGASLAEVSFTVDTVVSLENRESALKRVRQEALEGALGKGADSGSLRIVDLQVMPYHYVPGKMARVVAIASGSQKQ